MSLTPLTFTGISQFSTDFQTILNRAVSIAAIPVQQLQNEQTDVLARKQLLTELNSALSDLTARIGSLASIGEYKALSASSSNSFKVSATATGATAPASYTLSEITSVARAAAEMSSSGYATSGETAVSSTGTMKLIVGTSEYDITLEEGENNLIGLQNAINLSGAPVTASILTTGTGENPNYLSVTANSTGETTLRLVDDPEGAASEWLTANNQGANTRFKLNGVVVDKSTSYVNNVIPGMTFTVLDTTDVGETITLSLASDRDELGSALAALADSYNTVADLLNAQMGEAAGLLSGDFLVREAQGKLRELVSYSGSGTIRSLAELGIELDDTGVMTFNQTTFDSLSEGSIQEAFTFLGSTTTGFGQLQDSFESLTDPVTGLIRLQQDQYDETDQRLEQQVEVLSERITAMQTSLAAKLQLTDALLAQLESQQSLLSASIQSMNYSLYGTQEES